MSQGSGNHRPSQPTEDDRPKAVALRYDPDHSGAPRVTAKGEGLLAEKLIEIAKKHGVPIREDRNLVQVLSQLDLDREIPPQLYVAVAEILAFVYRVSTSLQEETGLALGDAKPNPTDAVPN
ncbi:MAG: EscU/YscU/HrcU family type III secretion system export apparatus switch protein [Acidobacteriota bacterium]